MGTKSLKDLIRSIRSCKTAADERSVIAKESAAIRSSFKDNNSSGRHRNVAKLLYIHMLGHPAHFGQIECLKLAASTKFSDKRLGYLGIMLLLDENQETLTLVTNSLKNDMNHVNMYIVGLALCTLANISSAEMAKDLSQEIEKHLSNPNSYIRKKAALCAIRIVRKVPELHDNFIAKTKNLLSDRNHGVLLTGTSLIYELCLLSDQVKCEYRNMIPIFTKLLASLLVGGTNPEYDVSGVMDPFLQVNLLRVLRILGHGNPEASEQMNDILAQAASSVESSKIAGNAILYEVVLTIFEIEAEPSLRTMAINLLGKFLSNKDNNMRYVALNTLSKIISADQSAVQRHRATVLECLHDPDISIRKRALELAFAIINETNVESVCRELLAYMEICDANFIPILASNITSAADQYATSPKWFVDTLMQVFKLAKEEVKEEAMTSFLRFVAQSATSLQTYATYQLYEALKSCHPSMIALIQCAAWCIGEYGQYMKIPGVYEGVTFISALERDVMMRLQALIDHRQVSYPCKYYIITALVKLSCRFPSLSNELKDILGKFTLDEDAELQQRAIEYLQLFDEESLRVAVLDRIPPPEHVPKFDLAKTRPALAPQTLKSMFGNSSTAELLADLDLMTIKDPQPTLPVKDETETAANVLSVPLHMSASLSRSASDADSGKGDDAAERRDSPLSPALSMGSPTRRTTAAHGPISLASLSLRECGQYFAYQGNGIEIHFTRWLDPSDATLVTVKVLFKNTYTESSITDLLFQTAVPKSMKLHMNPPSSTTIEPASQSIQILKIANPTMATLKMRMKINFTVDEERVNDMAEFVFPDPEEEIGV